MFELDIFCYRVQLFFWCLKFVSFVQVMENDIYGVDQRIGFFFLYVCFWLEFVVGWVGFEFFKLSQLNGFFVCCVFKNFG